MTRLYSTSPNQRTKSGNARNMCNMSLLKFLRCEIWAATGLSLGLANSSSNLSRRVTEIFPVHLPGGPLVASKSRRP
jgi:hypothetical protein